MSRIDLTLQKLAQTGRKALIPYITAGYPFASVTPELMHGMVQAGANIIELGVPFSDPMADGPVVQRAGERALSQGIGMREVLAHVRAFRADDAVTPVVLMGYANPVERYDQIHGQGRFVADAASAGVDGVLIVDYPPQECEQFAKALRSAGMDLIFLLAPTSTRERMQQIGRLASGYVYYVSLRGVTGSSALDISAVVQAMPKIRRYVTGVPIGVGFGIADAASAAAIAQVSDAVVIGSKIIQLLDSLPFEKVVSTASRFLREIRTAMDKATHG